MIPDFTGLPELSVIPAAGIILIYFLLSFKVNSKKFFDKLSEESDFIEDILKPALLNSIIIGIILFFGRMLLLF